MENNTEPNNNHLNDTHNDDLTITELREKYRFQAITCTIRIVVCALIFISVFFAFYFMLPSNIEHFIAYTVIAFVLFTAVGTWMTKKESEYIEVIKRRPLN